MSQATSVVVNSGVGPSRPVRHVSTPKHPTQHLLERFTPRQVDFINRLLTAEELSVISDLDDALIIARIKRMPHWQLRRFDALVPATRADWRAYSAQQVKWLRDEEYLLSTRLRRKPTHAELFADFMRNANGLRFRAYFAMKYPHCVRPSSPRHPATN